MMKAPADFVGTYFAHKFRVDTLIHTDALWALFLSVDMVLGRVVALKLFWSYSGDQQELDRVQREAMIAARMEHENTRRIYEAGRDPESGLPYIALEWIPGQILDEFLHLPISTYQFLRLARDLTAGLSIAHQDGLFHGGLSPLNILITTRSSGQLCARLLDFGAADLEAYQAAAATHITGEQVDAKILAHLSPEQLRGQPTDARTDVYALGTVLYSLICGHPPFKGNGPTIVKGHIDDPIPRPKPRHGLELPLLLEALIKRCLEKDPNDRFQDCRELHDVFSNLLREHAASARNAEAITAVTVDPLARYVIIGRSNGRVDVHTFVSGECITRFDAHRGAVKTLIFRPDNEEFLSSGEDGHIHLWGIKDQKHKGTWPGMRGALYALAFSPFGYIFASGEIDGRIRLWSLVEEGPLGEFQAHSGPVTALHFLPEGRFLASGGRDGRIQLWDISSMKLAERCEWQRGGVASLTMRVRDYFIAAFDDGSLAMGRWNRSEPQWHHRIHRYAVSKLFQQDGGQGVITTGLDGVVNSVDQFDGNLRRPALWHLEGIHAGVFHPRTETLFSSSDSILMKWRWTSGSQTPNLQGFLLPDDKHWRTT